MIRTRNAVAIALGLLVMLIAIAARSQTPEPPDPVIVSLSNDLTASQVAQGHLVESMKVLAQAYVEERGKLAAARKRAADLASYWKAYIAQPEPAKP